MLSRDGAMAVLRRLCVEEAKFRGLNEAITNTRTLTRRLKELLELGLIQRVGTSYRITSEGFDVTIAIAELERKAAERRVRFEELAKLRYGWMRLSLMRLIEIFNQEFSDELLSIVLYGSAVRDSFQLGRSDVDLLYILEDRSRNVWRREGRAFKGFQSTWEYRACDHWLKTQGTYGYPEVAMVWLLKSDAEKFQPIYLDMLSHRAVLYDTGEFFQNLMKRLEEALKALGTIRIEHPGGAHSWLLKPDIAPGELIEINLG